MKNVFIPLKTKYYEAFCDGAKTVEYRRYGPRWNEQTCKVGRRVTISKGYGKQHRRVGTIVGFSKRRMASKAWLECYGEPGLAACIEIRLNTLDISNDNERTSKERTPTSADDGNLPPRVDGGM